MNEKKEKRHLNLRKKLIKQPKILKQKEIPNDYRNVTEIITI